MILILMNGDWGPVTNGLRRYFPTGTWHIFRKVEGNLVRKATPHTNYNKARDWAETFLAKRKKQRRETVRTVERLQFRDAVALLKQSISLAVAEGKISSDRSVHYREECLAMITRNWPGIDDRAMDTFRPAELETFKNKILTEYSTSRFNGIMQNLRAVFAEAAKAGIIAGNPVEFKTIQVPPKDLVLPGVEDFQKLCETISRKAKGKHIVRAIKFLAMSGSRIGAAAALLRTDVHMDENTIVFRRKTVKGKKRDVALPMFPELRVLCLEILNTPHRRGDYFLPAIEFRQTLKTACAELRLPHMTPHDLRHLWATKILKNPGVSIREAAKWFGHSDGGALMLERYAHVIREDEMAAAKTVKFFTS